MTRRRVGLDIETTATTGQAKRNLGELRGDVQAIEGEHEIDVTVDDDASDELVDIRAKLNSLTDEDRRIALQVMAGDLERDVRRAENALGRLDRYDGDAIRVRVEARDNASKRLEAVRTELRQLDGDTARIRIEETGGLQDISDELGIIGGSTAGVAALGRGGLIGGAVLGAGALTNEFKNAAIEAGVLADQTGAGIEYASGLLSIWQAQGLEMNDLLDIMFNLNDRLRESPELVERLGVNMEDGKDLAERFVEVVGILRDDFDDVGERAQISAQLFGEEGVRQVGRVQLVVDDLDRAIEDLPSARIITDEDLENAVAFEREWQKTRGHLDAIVKTVGAGLLPGVNEFLSGRNLDPSGIPRALGGSLGADTADWFRGLFGGGDSGAPREPLSPSELDRSIRNLGGRVTIVNPPGSPTVTVTDTRDYDRRNGTVR